MSKKKESLIKHLPYVSKNSYDQKNLYWQLSIKHPCDVEKYIMDLLEPIASHVTTQTETKFNELYYDIYIELFLPMTFFELNKIFSDPKLDIRILVSPKRDSIFSADVYQRDVDAQSIVPSVRKDNGIQPAMTNDDVTSPNYVGVRGYFNNDSNSSFGDKWVPPVGKYSRKTYDEDEVWRPLKSGMKKFNKPPPTEYVFIYY